MGNHDDAQHQAYYEQGKRLKTIEMAQGESPVFDFRSKMFRKTIASRRVRGSECAVNRQACGVGEYHETILAPGSECQLLEQGPLPVVQRFEGSRNPAWIVTLGATSAHVQLKLFMDSMTNFSGAGTRTSDKKRTSCE
jgi:hypothetical protein